MIALLLTCALAFDPEARISETRANPDWFTWLERAEVFRANNRAEDAATAYAQALQMARLSGPEDPATAIVLHNTGFFHHQAGRVAQAERLYSQAQKWFAAHQPEYLEPLVRVVTNLSVVYAETGRWSKAEAQIRPWINAQFDREGDGARLRGVLASVLARQGKYAEAEPLMESVRAAIEREPRSELQQESLALTISNQAALYQATGRGAMALENYDAALGILTRLPSRRPVALVRTWHEAAVALMAAEEDQKALSLYRRAVDLAEGKLGRSHPVLATVLPGYAKLLRKLHRGGEASRLERRAELIRQSYERENLLGHTVDVQSFR
jgi:tetratricopeptide (TPR) repeat protein